MSGDGRGWRLVRIAADENPVRVSHQNYRIVNDNGGDAIDVTVASAIDDMWVGDSIRKWRDYFGTVASNGTIDIPYAVTGWSGDGAGFRVSWSDGDSRSTVVLKIADIDQ